MFCCAEETDRNLVVPSFLRQNASRGPIPTFAGNYRYGSFRGPLLCRFPFSISGFSDSVFLVKFCLLHRGNRRLLPMDAPQLGPPTFFFHLCFRTWSSWLWLQKNKTGAKQKRPSVQFRNQFGGKMEPSCRKKKIIKLYYQEVVLQ